MTRSVLISSLAVAGLMLGAAPAGAEEICIVCEEPRTIYRCAAQDGVTRAGDVRLGLACITEIARSGGHSSCSVSRRQPGTCQGALRSVAVGGLPPAVLGPPPKEAAAPAMPPQAGPESKTKSGPPATVAELAKRTAETSKEQLKKAGDGVSGAAKKTWRCLSTFFKDC